MKEINQYLLDAAKKTKEEIAAGNPYREIGFDGSRQRLGWVKPVSFEKIQHLLEALLPVFENKENFIFVGMGGSINGIKPLLTVFEKSNFFTLDNLDPKAIDAVLSRISSPAKTLVVSISKSGTTKETQLLSQALRAYLAGKLGREEWTDNFLWLSDPDSFAKLDGLGWEKAKKAPIQADRHNDIGGRFSSPHTQIFTLPLFLLLDKNMDKLKQIYFDFCNNQEQIRKQALDAVFALADDSKFYFSPVIESKWGLSFASWVIQLFQESLGSKKENKEVKTVVNFSGQGFTRLNPGINFNSPAATIMGQMYFYQIFVAYLSGRWGINFVTQNFVEKYKKKMKMLETGGSHPPDILQGSLSGMLSRVEEKISGKHRFIEVVFYFFPDKKTVELICREIKNKFTAKIVLNFLGSDWNHQSYQAAFSDRHTFYLLVSPSCYQDSAYIEKEKYRQNTEALSRIALATYQTLLGKSILYKLSLPSS